MKHPKRLLFLALAVAMLIGCALPSAAASLFKTIEVYTGVKIYMDDVNFIPKDVNGNPVDIFIYNGTTYLPARAVSNVLGVNVDWDGSTHSVYLGRHGDGDWLLDVCPPYQMGKLKLPSDFVTMAGKKYTKCIQEKNSDAITSDNSCYALFNLDGRYDKLSFLYGHIDGEPDSNRYLDIYLDGELVDSFEMTADMLPQRYEIDLNGALQLKIISRCNQYTTHAAYALAELKIS